MSETRHSFLYSSLTQSCPCCHSHFPFFPSYYSLSLYLILLWWAFRLSWLRVLKWPISLSFSLSLLFSPTCLPVTPLLLERMHSFLTLYWIINILNYSEIFNFHRISQGKWILFLILENLFNNFFAFFFFKYPFPESILESIFFRKEITIAFYRNPFGFSVELNFHPWFLSL